MPGEPKLEMTSPSKEVINFEMSLSEFLALSKWLSGNFISYEDENLMNAVKKICKYAQLIEENELVK